MVKYGEDQATVVVSDSSPGEGFDDASGAASGDASGGSGAHAQRADGHSSPSRGDGGDGGDGCAERASCATHQTKGHPERW